MSTMDGYQVKRHPIRATFAGGLAGLGLALLLGSFSIIAFGSMVMPVVVVAVAVLGLVLSLVVPPRGRPTAGTPAGS